MTDIAKQLRDAGWTYEEGIWVRPRTTASEHMHSASCTVESCGDRAMFVCGSVCIRGIRRGDDPPISCQGHRVPTRARLVEYALERKGLKEAAPSGTPIESENTWSE